MAPTGSPTLADLFNNDSVDGAEMKLVLFAALTAAMGVGLGAAGEWYAVPPRVVTKTTIVTQSVTPQVCLDALTAADAVNLKQKVLDGLSYQISQYVTQSNDADSAFQEARYIRDKAAMATALETFKSVVAKWDALPKLGDTRAELAAYKGAAASCRVS
jgi:hypothetical protein